jgi:hypothetical protein
MSDLTIADWIRIRKPHHVNWFAPVFIQEGYSQAATPHSLPYPRNAARQRVQRDTQQPAASTLQFYISHFNNNI